MVRLLHQLGCRQHRLVLRAELLKVCDRQVLERVHQVVLELAVREALVVLAERKNHQHKCASSHSSGICSSVVPST